MKFLLDSHLLHRVAQLLRDVTHVRNNGLQHMIELANILDVSAPVNSPLVTARSPVSWSGGQRVWSISAQPKD
jgi:predicted nuclease of predicted toxin-antitoxin system